MRPSSDSLVALSPRFERETSWFAADACPDTLDALGKVCCNSRSITGFVLVHLRAKSPCHEVRVQEVRWGLWSASVVIRTDSEQSPGAVRVSIRSGVTVGESPEPLRPGRPSVGEPEDDSLAGAVRRRRVFSNVTLLIVFLVLRDPLGPPGQ